MQTSPVWKCRETELSWESQPHNAAQEGRQFLQLLTANDKPLLPPSTPPVALPVSQDMCPKARSTLRLPPGF